MAGLKAGAPTPQSITVHEQSRVLEVVEDRTQVDMNLARPSLKRHATDWPHPVLKYFPVLAG